MIHAMIYMNLIYTITQSIQVYAVLETDEVKGKI